jgi:membrane protease YdiL (CAAX protease family)
VDVSDVRNERSVTNGKLAAWLGLVVALSTIAYASRAAGGAPDSDVLYKYSTAISALVQYAVMLGLVAAISVGLRREELGLRPPFRLGTAIGLAVLVLVATDVVGLIVDQFANPGKEQGLTPHEWDPSRAAPFVVNFVIVAGVAPFVEELMFRGLGYRVLEPFGRWVAILGVGLAFALVHGLISGFVILFFFGAALAWLRSETGSIYPGIGVHALFNAIALVLAVTT